MIKCILFYIWQLPQHILGLLLILISRAKYNKLTGCWVGKKIFSLWGISLGNYRIFSGHKPSLLSIRHECGHSEQSKYLGPLYLIIVGIPSLIRALYSRLWCYYHWTYYKRYEWYYGHYPENWADRLGGVVR